MSNFKLILSSKASNVIPVNKYVSQKTGLTIIIANVDGPLVNGFFCLGLHFYVTSFTVIVLVCKISNNFIQLCNTMCLICVMFSEAMKPTIIGGFQF